MLKKAIIFTIITPLISCYGANASEEKSYFAFFNYSYLDLLVPGKWGATVGVSLSEEESWELEYLQGSLADPFVLDNVGDVVDRRLSLIKRREIFGGFANFAYGVVYFDLRARLGNDLLDSVATENSSVELIRAKSLGSYLALGSRLRVGKRALLGVDWIGWSQPWVTLEESSEFIERTVSEKDKDTVQNVLKIVTRSPRFTLLKVQFGMRF